MPKKKINRGGLIPYIKKDDEIYMLFMKPSKAKFGGDVFQIAKGKQEEGEDIGQTALREASEELGLFPGNIVHLDNLGVWLGRTTIFIAEIKDPEMFGDPTTPDEVKEVKWMTLAEFNKVGRGLHKPIVKAAHRKMEKMLIGKQGIKEVASDYFTENLYEMSNFQSNKTGLMDGTVMWVRTEPIELPHIKFRFKLKHPQKGSAVMGFWGDSAEQVAGDWKLTSQELSQVRRFAALNRAALLSHINGDTDSSDLSNSLLQHKDEVNK